MAMSDSFFPYSFQGSATQILIYLIYVALVLLEAGHNDILLVADLLVERGEGGAGGLGRLAPRVADEHDGAAVLQQRAGAPAAHVTSTRPRYRRDSSQAVAAAAVTVLVS
jgi:hypothetical protein